MTAHPLTAAQMQQGTGVQRSSTDGERGTIGVGTFNAFVGLSEAQARHDVQVLTDFDWLDLIGWQEVNANPPAPLGLAERGWETVQPLRPNGNPHELAVSWRSSEFTLVGSVITRMHADSASTEGDDRSFPARWVLQVVLQRTGAFPDRVTVLNTHVNHRLERWPSKPGQPFENVNTAKARGHLKKLADLVDAADSRYTVILGDFNWDYVADQQTRDPAFVHGQLGERAISGWEALGIRDQPVSHPSSDRRIDYVFLSRSSPAAFRSQSVVDGLHSDHRPVVARIALG